MAIDKVSIWRNSPTSEIALDNELFLEAQQSQFLLKDLALPSGTLVEALKLKLTQPSIIIGSISLSAASTIAFTNLTSPPVAGYNITYSGYQDSTPGAEVTFTVFAHTVTVDSLRCTFICKASPHRTLRSLELSLNITSPGGGKLLAGSFIKIL